MTVSPFLRNFLTWALLSCLLVVGSWHFFTAPFQEQGDIALNALQVDRAKSLAELYGNYSRFQFNHPGPAFFYVYAAAEIVLSDKLGWMAPHCAHSLGGLLLQAGFFVLGLHLFSRFTRSPFFLPLALLVGALHFSKSGAAFLSIWPPHVLLMPFFAFWAACVSVAMGRGRDLIWVALAGCFLVHGHVAQPLFVGTLTIVAYVCLYRRLARGEVAMSPWRAFPVAHASAVLVIGLFLTPLLIDLAKGQESNLADIWRHLRFAEDKKKFAKTLLYFLTFFSYLQNQDEILRELSWKSTSFLREHALLYLGWVALLVFVLRSAFRNGGADRSGPSVIRTAVGFWVLTACLCIYWGRMQSGPMFQFNGYFFHAVLYVLLLIGLLALIEKVPLDARLPRTPRLGIQVVSVVLALVVVWNGIRYPSIARHELGVDIRERTLAAVAADPRKEAPKLLVFAHPYWPAAASISLVLKREGVPFLVEPSWTFMWQKEHELSPELVTLPDSPISVWRLLPEKPDAKVAREENWRIVTEPAELSPSAGTIDFSDSGNYELYQVVGFSTPERGNFAPTAQKDAILQFKALPAEDDVALHMVAEPFLGADRTKVQPTELRFNGHLVFAAPFTEPGVLRAKITKELWNSRPVATVHLSMPNALSPAELGLSGDVRRLGLSVKKLTTRYSDE